MPHAFGGIFYDYGANILHCNALTMRAHTVHINYRLSVTQTTRHTHTQFTPRAIVSPSTNMICANTAHKVCTKVISATICIQTSACACGNKFTVFMPNLLLYACAFMSGRLTSADVVYELRQLVRFQFSSSTWARAVHTAHTTRRPQNSSADFMRQLHSGPLCE